MEKNVQRKLTRIEKSRACSA